MRTRRVRTIGVLLFVGALAVAAVVSQVGRSGSERVRIGTGSISALSRTAKLSDRLPPEVLSYPFAGHNFASPSGGGSRLLKAEGSLSLYVVPGKAGMVCLVEVDQLAQTSGAACADRNVLLTGSIFMADRNDDGTQQVVGLVGDGHTYAEARGQRVAVDGNVFVLRGVGSSEVTIGSTTAAQTVEIGG
jgi:hypothetical protein